MSAEATRCREIVTGPRVSRRVVLWRDQCGRKTKHPSGYCHQHRMGRDLTEES